MTPEAADYLEKARQDLADARKVADIGLAAVAARLAYYAAFHAAEALVLARLGRVGKTHSGVRADVARVLIDEEDKGRGMLTFLAHAYSHKQVADYAVGSRSSITQKHADDAITGAEEWIDRVAAMLDR